MQKVITDGFARVILHRIKKQEIPKFENLKTLVDNEKIKHDDLEELVAKAVDKYNSLLL